MRKVWFLIFGGLFSVNAAKTVMAQVDVNAMVGAQVKKEMAAMDTDNDGVVNEAEFLAYRVKLYQEQQKKIFAELDSDGNGGLVESEYTMVLRKKMEETANSIVQAVKKVNDKAQAERAGANLTVQP